MLRLGRLNFQEDGHCQNARPQLFVLPFKGIQQVIVLS